MWIGKVFLLILLRFISHTCNIITIIIHEDFTTSIAALLFFLCPSLRHYSLWIFKNYNSVLLHEGYQQISWYYKKESIVNRMSVTSIPKSKLQSFSSIFYYTLNSHWLKTQFMWRGAIKTKIALGWYKTIRLSSFKKSDWSRYMIYFLLLKWDNDLLQCLWKHAQSQNNYAPCSFELVKYKLWSKCLKTWHLTEKVDLIFFNLRQIWRKAWLLFKIMTSEQRCIILKLKLTIFFR